MAAVLFQNNGLDMFYGHLKDENLPNPLEPKRIIIYLWKARTDFGDWRQVWKMDAPRGKQRYFKFCRKNENKFVKMKNEMQSLGMIKVEFAVVVKMAKKNENGETTHFNKYMKNEAWLFQNENEDEIREKVMKLVDEVNNRIESCVENGSQIVFEEAETA